MNYTIALCALLATMAQTELLLISIKNTPVSRAAHRFATQVATTATAIKNAAQTPLARAIVAGGPTLLIGFAAPAMAAKIGPIAGPVAVLGIALWVGMTSADASYGLKKQ
jgi:hypothetical protein